jgi:hypothetical protein
MRFTSEERALAQLFWFFLEKKEKNIIPSSLKRQLSSLNHLLKTGI